MRLLFLTPQLPYPPRQGTALRNWGLIRHLAARHALSLLSFAEPGQAADAPELRAACQEVIALPAPARSRLARLLGLLRPAPDLAQRLWSPAFAAALTALLKRAAFDVVQIEGLEMAPYARLARASAARIIYDAHNVEFSLQARAAAADARQPRRWHAAAYSAVQQPRLRAYEAAVARDADGVVCVSAVDGQALRQLAPGVQPALVPNGIDLDSYSPQPAPGGARLVFTGKMDYRPNVDAVTWFARAILPRVRAAHPTAEFIIVGQKPAAAVQALRALPGVTLTGAVDDVRPHIAGAAVYVAPLRMGGGTRLKLLEAMALERPVVSTTLGAEGFEVQSGRDLLLADEPEAFAAGILRLLDQPEFAASLGRAGRTNVAARFDWPALIPALEACYQ